MTRRCGKPWEMSNLGATCPARVVSTWEGLKSCWEQLGWGKSWKAFDPATFTSCDWKMLVIESWLISDHSPWLLAVSRQTSSPLNQQFHFTVSFSQQVPTVSSSILLQFLAMFSSTGKKRYRWYLQDFQRLHWHLRKFMLIVEWHGQLIYLVASSSRDFFEGTSFWELQKRLLRL